MPTVYPHPNSKGSFLRQCRVTLTVTIVLLIQKATRIVLLMLRSWPRPFSPGFKPPSFTSISARCGTGLNATEWSLASVKKHEPSGSIPYPGAACGHLTSCLVFYFPLSLQLSPSLPQGDQIPLPSPEELQGQRTLTPNGTQST